MVSKKLPGGYEWAVCITHDVDVLSMKEFGFSRQIPFCIVPAGIEVLRKQRGMMNFFSYAKAILGSAAGSSNDIWSNLDSLIEFDRGLPVTFFVATKSGSGIKYSAEQIRPVVSMLIENGFDVGLHGQNIDDLEMMKEEYEALAEIMGSGKSPAGIRTHKLRFDRSTADMLNRVGYVYDSSIENLEQFGPYTIHGNLIEVPLNIRDCRLFQVKKMGMDLRAAKKKTLELIAAAKTQGGVLSILLHQRFFSSFYPRHFEWYRWLLGMIRNDDRCWKASCLDIAKWYKEQY